jgi:hypothetical protein
VSRRLTRRDGPRRGSVLAAMTNLDAAEPAEEPALRKQRGAFFRNCQVDGGWGFDRSMRGGSSCVRGRHAVVVV